MASKSVERFKQGVPECDRRQTDRQTDHGIEKYGRIGELDCAARAILPKNERILTKFCGIFVHGLIRRKRLNFGGDLQGLFCVFWIIQDFFAIREDKA